MGEANPDGRSAQSSTQNTVHGATGTSVQIGSLTGDVVLHGRFDGSSGRPRQVPPTPRGFVDRETILSTLDRLLTGDPVAPRQLVVISGLAGVGKSAVVRRWTQEWGDRFPGGQLYVDWAAVRTDSGAPVSDALADCLAALGVQHEHIPATLSARTNLFRTLTAATSGRKKSFFRPDSLLKTCHSRPRCSGSIQCSIRCGTIGYTQRAGLTGLPNILPSMDSSFASMHTATENDSSSKSMIC